MGDSSTRTGVGQQQLDWPETTPSTAGIDAIASAENTAATDVSTELDTTLFDHVDPEARDALITGDNPSRFRSPSTNTRFNSMEMNWRLPMVENPIRTVQTYPNDAIDRAGSCG